MRAAIFLIGFLLSGFLFSQASFEEITDTENLFTSKNARGISLVDFDNDGDDDLFIAAEPIRILRNEGNFNFVDFTDQSGIEIQGARTLQLFDANNDGFLDVFLSSLTSSKLYLSNQGLSFSEAFTFSPWRRNSVNFGDLNGDQWPDIYSANFNQENNIYINQGNGQFVNAYGDDSKPSLDMGAILIDIEEDGDLDVYITYDGNNPNDLLINDGTGAFQNAASDWALDNRSSAMGVDFADFNRDGNYDFYIANLRENDLLISNGDNTFSEIGASALVDDTGMGWGTVCFDYDNDGLTDIYFNNEYFRFSSSSNQLLKNNGDLTFSDVAVGTALTNDLSGYGCATSDLNNDGLLDLVLVNLQETKSIRIFKNNESTPNNWVQFSLTGIHSNKFGIGARLKVFADEVQYVSSVKAGSGYRSQNSFRQHIGLGPSGTIDSLLIYWPSGAVDKYEDLETNIHYMISEGENISPFNSTDFAEVLTRENFLANPYPTEAKSVELTDNQSIAREWMEVLLDGIRGDFARPTVHARNLFHISLAMYDAWAVFDPKSETIFLGKDFGGYFSEFEGFTSNKNIEEAKVEAICYAAYTLISHRFENSPSAGETLANAYQLIQAFGYDVNFTSADYSSGSPAALGNYIAKEIIEFGLQDGSNEINGYQNQYYVPVNPPMQPELAGNPDCANPNRWQQLKLQVSIDQSGNPVLNTQPFLGPEWGQVTPFSLNESDATIYNRDGFNYWVYHDPGPPPTLDIENGGGLSNQYKWNFEMVSKWSSHLDPSDDLMIDISPSAIGNISEDAYPETFEEYFSFYPDTGGDPGQGYELNPITDEPYVSQVVPRGDYSRVLAEFWADGPDSETPPGHWFTILNYVTDHEEYDREFMGNGATMDLLEWDVKSYVALGGAMHDVAITAWGIKGYYDYTRPIFALRYLSDMGQSSDENLPNYHPAGIELIDNYIELVLEGDALAGDSNENIGKIKVRSWKGPEYIDDPDVDVSGVNWILAENWWPYQRPSFVTPPFAGYISGHSTFSRAAAEVLTLLTGSEYFPGALGEFHAPKNDFLVFEDGPSVDIILQWAKYKDASDQCSLSRIWGGIHPPVDDIPGRLIGRIIGQDAFYKALSFFEPPLAINDKEKLIKDSFLYPNPLKTREQVFVNSNLKPILINCWSISGKKIFSNLKLNPDRSIPFSFNDGGTYIIELVLPAKNVLKKIMVRQDE